MSKLFAELDYRITPIGALSLRRRRELSSGADIFEIKLGDEFLMSSQFTVSEIALAELGLAVLQGRQLDVIVGGLGLGYTARAVLENEKVKSLIIIELLDAVIDWNVTGLLPLGTALANDSRSQIVQGDFFALAMGRSGFDKAVPGRRFDAILLDIDHSPEALLDGRSTSFYKPDGLRALSAHLKPGGVFGLWSNDKPDPAFTERLGGVFAEAWAEPVTFYNRLQDRPCTQTVYLARAKRSPLEAA